MYKIINRKCQISSIWYLLNQVSNNWNKNPVSDIMHQIPSIGYQVSDIKYQISSFRYYVSDIKYQISNI